MGDNAEKWYNKRQYILAETRIDPVREVIKTIKSSIYRFNPLPNEILLNLVEPNTPTDILINYYYRLGS